MKDGLLLWLVAALELDLLSAEDREAGDDGGRCGRLLLDDLALLDAETCCSRYSKNKGLLSLASGVLGLEDCCRCFCWRRW